MPWTDVLDRVFPLQEVDSARHERILAVEGAYLRCCLMGSMETSIYTWLQKQEVDEKTRTDFEALYDQEWYEYSQR